jgi:Caspase domain
MMVKLARQGGLLGWGAIALSVQLLSVLLLPRIGLANSYQGSLSKIVIAQALGAQNTAQKERRTALVIGNSAYPVGGLANPTNDAADLTAILKDLGFEVTLLPDVNLQQMKDAIDKFSKDLKAGGIGLFFYAGHGIQVKGENYIIPINAAITREADVKNQAFSLTKIIDSMDKAGNPVNLIMIDACRNNPYSKKWRSTSRGLADLVRRPEGMLISFSTSPGEIAADGDGRNSPYTSSLLRNIGAENTPLELIFRNTRQEVMDRTAKQQRPWELSSLTGNVFLKPAAVVINQPPDSGFTWEQGISGNKYKGNAMKDVLLITALPKTDVLNNTEPRVVRPVDGDFEAIVKVNFSSDIKYQRATLGLKDGSDIIMRLYLLEGKRVEAAFYPENNTQVPSNIKVYPDSYAYLKIRKQKGKLSAFYSKDKSNWSLILERQMEKDLPSMNVFMSVLSTDSVKGASAEFSEFKIQPL